MPEQITRQKREYKGDIREDGYIYYTYNKKVKLSNGEYKLYKNTVKRKRPAKLRKRGKDKKKRKKGSGRPQKIKNKIKKIVDNMDQSSQQKLHEYILIHYKDATNTSNLVKNTQQPIQEYNNLNTTLVN